MRTIDTVIFDYGGVICSSRSTLFSNTLGKEFNIEPKDIKEILRSETWDRYVAGSGSAEECYSMLQAIGLPFSITELQKRYASFGKANPKMKELLQRLKSNGFTLAILSNSLPEFTQVAREDLDGLCSAEIFSEEVHLRKPEPEIYGLALRSLKKSPSGCLFIDDAEENLVYPRKIGMHTHQFRGHEELVRELKENYGIDLQESD